ncbi:hypothetical protein [Streptomyces sp. JB150]|uniref:hypothetical protein n=1 Tax=Streptomyces sp. JB150 TaxID=2714844 RepID=UPI0014082EA0|nr:hypothetical protein [Streptomyces sp. JB150]QIJ65344.1 hypothetical protein G7Z13_27400 [Streptomyces sp. JB150]
MLARGRADLALLRDGGPDASDVLRAVAADPVRRRLVLRAAQFDRAEGDPPLLRAEARASMTDELRLAAVLVGLRGDPGDVPLLHAVRETDFDTRCGLGDIPALDADGAELRAWARRTDEALFGTDPTEEPLSTWTEPARDQGLTTLARVALIRRLDAIELNQSLLRSPGDPTRPDPSPLRGIAHELEELGDLGQASRARRQYAALQDTGWDRASARLRQAALERRTGRLGRAVRSLASVRDALADAESVSGHSRRRVDLGLFVAREHCTLNGALADADRPEEARALLALAEEIRGGLPEAAAHGVGQLAAATAARVGAIS